MIHKVKNMKSLIRYCITPKKSQTSEERVAKLYCDLCDANSFLKYAEDTLKAKNRSVQGYSIIQSFPQTEFDVNNEKHIEFVNDLGRKLAYILYPNSPCMIITHADTQCLHNHIIAINHDLSSNKAIYLNRRVKDVRESNDELMSQYHLEVCQPSLSPKTQGEYWSNKRNSWLDTLKENIDKVLSFATSIQEFEDCLLSEGITPVLYRKNGGLKERFSYKVTDIDNKEHTKRSDKLGEQYTREAIEKQLLENKKKKDLASVMPMDEWIKLQELKNNAIQHQQEESIIQNVEITEPQPKLAYKKTEAIDTLEKEKQKQEEQQMKEKIILEEIVNDKIYQELLEKRASIMKHIERIKEKAINGTDTDEDDTLLDNLERQLAVINFSIDRHSSSSKKVEMKEKLNENLLSQHPISDKNIEFSL